MTTADAIITANTIHTMDPQNPEVESIAIKDGRVLAMGDLAKVERSCDATTHRVAFPGVLTPGLTDAHTHIVMGTIWTRGLDLTDLSFGQVADSLARHAEQPSSDDWIWGWGLDPNIFPHEFDGRIFDTATSGRPMFLRMRDGHSAVCNSAAMRLAAITGREEFRDESRIGTDGSGAPTGYLVEFSAMDLVLRHCPEETIPALGKRLFGLLTEMAATGLTGTHVLDFNPPALEVMTWIEENHDLPLRVRFSPLIFPGTDESDWETIASIQGTGGRRWIVDGVKFMIDGTVDNGSAWLREPDEFGQGTTSIWTDTDDYRHALKYFARKGISTATHAIGDQGVSFVLDSLEELGDMRLKAAHRIEHIETIPDETVVRFAELDIAASMQPIHGTHHTKADGTDNWSVRLGPVRAGHGWRCRDLRAAGAVVALGSDWPIAPFDPLEMMADSVLRRPARRPDTPPIRLEQSLSIKQAFEGYTSHAAKAANVSNLSGSIGIGKYADFTVFGSDPLLAHADELADISVLATFVDGQQYQGETRARLNSYLEPIDSDNQPITSETGRKLDD
ncbi:amidohydrolase [Brevibacterium linens]|uniref:amidohydrolase n=1 Tax=Brevibacterium linens TaxID=1703 RepID=UPI003BF5D65C